MTRRKGNPDSLKPYMLTTDRDEPLIHKVTVKVPKSMNDELNTIENKAEFLRNAIRKALDERKQDIIPDTLQ